MLLYIILLSVSPLLLYLGIARFFPIQERLFPRKYPIKALCTMPTCIRCAKNSQVVKRAKTLFDDAYGKFSISMARISDGLNESIAEKTELIFSVPRLPSRPVYAGENMPKNIALDAAKLEDNFATIKLAGLQAQRTPLRWQKNTEADGSCWAVYSFVNQGKWQEDNCQLFPDVADVLHTLDGIMSDCIFGNAFFSILPPGATIATHRGPTNVRLRVHLGLDVPVGDSGEPGCCMIVDTENLLTWTEGKCFVFDDSYPHSVSSKEAKAQRLALIVDLWHPDLSFLEKTALRRLFPAYEQ